MVQHNTSRSQTAPAHRYEWVEHTLRPIAVSPPSGGFDADDVLALKSCPICGRAMREHTVIHAAHDSLLNCPVPHPGAWDRDAFEPVNEFGMVTHRRLDKPATE